MFYSHFFAYNAVFDCCLAVSWSFVVICNEIMNCAIEYKDLLAVRLFFEIGF